MCHKVVSLVLVLFLLFTPAAFAESPPTPTNGDGLLAWIWNAIVELLAEGANSAPTTAPSELDSSEASPWGHPDDLDSSETEAEGDIGPVNDPTG